MKWVRNDTRTTSHILATEFRIQCVKRPRCYFRTYSSPENFEPEMSFNTPFSLRIFVADGVPDGLRTLKALQEEEASKSSVRFSLFRQFSLSCLTFVNSRT